MAQTYTLDEAAARLGIAPEEFKRRLRDDWKQVRSFRDGATLRFRAADIDELARATGQASDPGLPLGSAAPLADDSDELLVQPPRAKMRRGQGRQPWLLGDDSDDILALTDDKGKGKKGDSDVRLDVSPKRAGAGDSVATEELSLDVGGPTSGVGLGKKSSAKLTNPKSSGRLSGTGKSKIPTPESPSADDGSSEFELSLDSDSDSFELQLANDSSEEVPLGVESPPAGGQSGINLGRPADSGVSIEKSKKKPAADESDVDFELSIDGPGSDAARPRSGRPAADEGSSEFELSLDDSSGSESMNALASSVQGSGDIFETDFELPAVEDESGSEVVAVESDTDMENSDFEVAVTDDDVAADDGSASEVVLMEEDEGVTAPSGRSGRSALAGLDADDHDDVRPRGRTETVVRTVAASPPKWGPLPAVVLGLTLPIVFLGAIMSFELVRSMAGYQQASPLASWVAGLFGMKTGA
ncbi:MAG: hypothetical protein ABGY75_15845 [Gemmataceae bacterium]